MRKYSPAIFTVNVSAATKTAQLGVQRLGTATAAKTFPVPGFISRQKIISGIKGGRKKSVSQLLQECHNYLKGNLDDCRLVFAATTSFYKHRFASQQAINYSIRLSHVLITIQSICMCNPLRYLNLKAAQGVLQ